MHTLKLYVGWHIIVRFFHLAKNLLFYKMDPSPRLLSLSRYKKPCIVSTPLSTHHDIIATEDSNFISSQSL